MAQVDQRRRALVAFGGFGLWWGAWGALLPAVRRSTGVDDGQLGAALLLIAVGALVSMRVTGWLIDRFGGPVLPTTMAAFALVGVGPALVDGPVGLSASLLLVGAASGALDVAINADGTRVEAATGRPLLNLAHATFSVGVIVGSVGAGVARAAGLSLGASLSSVTVVLLGVAVWLSIGGLHPPAPRSPTVERTWRWWRPPRVLMAIGTLLALAFLVENAWQTWAAVHLERDLGTSDALAAAGPATFGASAAAGRLLAHRLAATGRDQQVVVGGAVLAGIGTAAGALAPSTVVVLLAIAVTGLGTASCAPTLLAWAGRAADESVRGGAVGTVTTIGYLGFALAPALVGGVARATTLPVALASVGGVAALLALGASRLTPPPAPTGR